MRLSVPLLYQARVLLPRKRNEAVATFLTRIDVDVPELSDAAAPIVARAHVPRLLSNGNPEVRTTEYRALGDGLVTPFTAAANLSCEPWREAPPFPAADLPAALDAWHAAALADARERNGRPDVRQQPLVPRSQWFDGPFLEREATEVRQWGGDDRAEREAALRQHLEKNARVIDGALWLASSGPAYCISQAHERNDENRYVPVFTVSVITTTDYVDDHGRASVFPPDRRDDALADARRRAEAARRQGARAEETVRGRIDILDRRRAVRNELPGLLLGAARALATQVGQEINRLPTDSVRLYADLRDALEVAKNEVDDLQFETILMMARDLNGRWAEAHGGKTPLGKHNPMLALEARLRVARGVPAEFAGEDVPVLDAAEIRRLGL